MVVNMYRVKYIYEGIEYHQELLATNEYNAMDVAYVTNPDREIVSAEIIEGWRD